jgi:hypothetical protein
VKVRRSDPEVEEAQYGAALVSSFGVIVEGDFPRWPTTEQKMSDVMSGGSLKTQALGLVSIRCRHKVMQRTVT